MQSKGKMTSESKQRAGYFPIYEKSGSRKHGRNFATEKLSTANGASQISTRQRYRNNQYIEKKGRRGQVDRENTSRRRRLELFDHRYTLHFLELDLTYLLSRDIESLKGKASESAESLDGDLHAMDNKTFDVVSNSN